MTRFIVWAVTFLGFGVFLAVFSINRNLVFGALLVLMFGTYLRFPLFALACSTALAAIVPFTTIVRPIFAIFFLGAAINVPIIFGYQVRGEQKAQFPWTAMVCTLEAVGIFFSLKFDHPLFALAAMIPLIIVLVRKMLHWLDRLGEETNDPLCYR